MSLGRRRLLSDTTEAPEGLQGDGCGDGHGGDMVGDGDGHPEGKARTCESGC